MPRLLFAGDIRDIQRSQAAFKRLNDDLVSAPVLGSPDPKLQYIIDINASAVGVGAVFLQIQEGKGYRLL